MRLHTKKWFLAAAVLAVLFTSRIDQIAHWLWRFNVVDAARDFERTYLTGSTIAVIAVLLILLRGNLSR